ncbi:hypothetical protein ABIA33_004703 [Streptacidiphilus sp. MAP12-16]|jgi:hypothetical protein|uniref:hypothetical protein n=1 Tax=Streptacidiphilus sp. MAP12-16 TaxID=3156300 RepID=UPI0035127743
MHLVLACLIRRQPGRTHPQEAAEVVDILWAHATAADHLEHARAHAHPSRVDLLLFLRETADQDPQHQAATLLARCHRASPLLRERYRPPAPEYGQPPAPLTPLTSGHLTSPTPEEDTPS